jgi:glycosyltransferase involved in cell wall biosynthesis
VRVLHVTPYFAPAFRYGGPPRSVLGLCRGLARVGVEVEVLTTTADGPADLPASPPAGSRHEGVAVRYLQRAFPRRLFGARGLGLALDGAIARADLVHIHGLWTLPGSAAARRARRAGVPVVISPRGMLDPGSIAQRAWRKRIAYAVAERRNLLGAALLHATSDAEARALRVWVPGSPVVTVPNGVDAPGAGLTPPGAARARLGIPEGAPLLLFLGRIHPIKRLDLLAAAFDRVRVALPDARLVIAGPDERGERRRLEPFFAAAARHSVHWIGETGDAEKWALLGAADLLVLCSDSESFGMSALEAMAAGTPVVVTRTCPWPEIETERAGFWVAQEPEAIARAALAILGDDERARDMGARGRVLARTRYSWDVAASAMAGHYRRAVERRPIPLVVTPGITGADGISAMSRLVAGALAFARVLSLTDSRSATAGEGVGLIGAGASRLRFASRVLALALRRDESHGAPSRDVVCLHLRLAPAARFLAGRGARLTIVLVGIEAWRPLRELERRALERADRILAISAHTLRRFRLANPRFAGRAISVCHLGVGDAVAAPTSGEAGPFALIVGRLAAAERYKGHDLLIEMWPRIAAQCPGARLVVAGDGDDRPRLERVAAALGNAVRFTGRASEAQLAALYRDCAFFVMPSSDEGFGLVFLEAMRAGKACIGAPGSAAELIEDGLTGFVVDPNMPEQVEKAVVRLFQDPELVARLGRAGAQRWAGEFTEEAFAKRLRDLLAH